MSLDILHTIYSYLPASPDRDNAFLTCKSWSRNRQYMYYCCKLYFYRNYYVGATHDYGIHHFSSIQEAIDNASSGQIIIVGVYKIYLI